MESIIGRVNYYIVNPVLGFLFVLATAYFLFGVVEYFLYQDSEDKRETGKQHIIWGLVGIFIMVAFWGIIQILAKTVNVSVSRP